VKTARCLNQAFYAQEDAVVHAGGTTGSKMLVWCAEAPGAITVDTVAPLLAKKG